jgi:hypothetical protein
MHGLALALALLAPFVAAKPRVSAAWHAGWHATELPPSKVSWDKYAVYRRYDGVVLTIA